MKAYCCQLDIVWENKKANYTKVQALLDAAQASPGSLVVLPEMFSTGFSMNVDAIHEGTPSESESFLAAMAREHEVFIMGGLVTMGSDKRGRNKSVVFDPNGRRIARYQKIHPFTLGGESKHYSAGAQIATFTWQGFQIAPFVCYDLRFPEIFRAAVREGAQVFAVIANWPVKREAHWITLLQARAIENQAYVIGVNRAGNDPQFTYSGRSLIVNPHGIIIADAGHDEAMISAELDLEKLKAWRRDFPALLDIHPEFIAGGK